MALPFRGAMKYRILALLLLSAELGWTQSVQPKLAWRQSMGGAAISSLQYLNNTIAVVCQGGILILFGQKDGKALWQYKTNGRLHPFLARGSEIV
ncbi:hypothetical protein FACS1894102_1410 [Spirochaetia bacterium]|nr:hypothetical protein FACS1894102_1410 [Spirochaetia bacterium]